VITVIADTHAILWFMSGDTHLSAAAKAALTLPPGEQIGLSAVTLIEILYLQEKGRIYEGSLAALKREITASDSAIDVVSVDRAIVDAMHRVARAEVPDLPDRIIAATAVALGVPLVSRDAKIRSTALVTTIW
jgi:PIN domain nuclease of toxin-antitoxin system